MYRYMTNQYTAYFQAKLEQDMRDFSAEYHRKVLGGQAPAAHRYGVDDDEEGGEEDVATVLADGVIDVTPTKKKPVSSWTSCVPYPGVFSCCYWCWCLCYCGGVAGARAGAGGLVGGVCRISCTSTRRYLFREISKMWNARVVA